MSHIGREMQRRGYVAVLNFINEGCRPGIVSLIVPPHNKHSRLIVGMNQTPGTNQLMQNINIDLTKPSTNQTKPFNLQETEQHLFPNCSTEGQAIQLMQQAYYIGDNIINLKEPQYVLSTRCEQSARQLLDQMRYLKLTSTEIFEYIADHLNRPSEPQIVIN
tara:strand:- start:6 stop:491 length:486 start_codon:yes stop_codon:yes gene_type:complete